VYLSALNGGGQATQGIKGVGVLDANAHFKLIRLDDGSFALQTVNGRELRHGQRRRGPAETIS
jgi:hypothetical protein